MEYITLRNGVKMPQLGYGVFRIQKEVCEACVLQALRIGYRSIDTAVVYGNEEEIGSAVYKSGISREEIFFTTKVWPTQFSEDRAYACVLASMKKLRTNYLDLVLLHQPFGDTYGAWRAFESLYEEGKVRAIGVSNFYPDRLVDFIFFTRIAPMVNQIEIHPFFQREEDLGWMKKYGVSPEAWALFSEGKGGLFTNPVLVGIGENYKKSAAQVMLRWNMQRGAIVIPRSTNAGRMKGNFEVFDFSLSKEDMTVIAALEKKQPIFYTHQDPHEVESFANCILRK